jgi:ABC-type polysaccharide transport system permease subunit
MVHKRTLSINCSGMHKATGTLLCIPEHFDAYRNTFLSTVPVCMLNCTTIMIRGGLIWWLLFTYAPCIRIILMHNNFSPLRCCTVELDQTQILIVTNHPWLVIYACAYNTIQYQQLISLSMIDIAHSKTHYREA